MADKNERLDRARQKEADSAKESTDLNSMYYRARKSNLDSRDKKQGRKDKGR